MRLSRREFAITSLKTAQGILIGCALPWGLEAADASPYPLNAWLEFPAVGEPVFVMGFCEMGQGTLTGLAMLICEELDFPVERLQHRLGPADQRFNHPKYQYQVTGGSSAITALYDIMRELGATARDVLLQAAAKRWQLAQTALVTDAGVIRASDGRTLRYQEVAAEAANFSPNKIVLKSEGQFKVIGKPTRRLDSTAKVTGHATFGFDVTLPDLLVAQMVHPPILGDRPKSVDDRDARAVPGFQKTIMLPTGVAVVCKRYWQTLKAVPLVKIKWQGTGNTSFSTETLMAKFRNKLDKEQGYVMTRHGFVEDGRKAATKTLTAEYSVPYLAHATMEPMNCTAWYDAAAGTLKLWSSTQAPGLVRADAADAVGLPRSKVQVETTFVGGGFGRRLEADYAVEAALIAKELSQPVKMIWSREEDTANDFYRPCAVSRFEGGLSEAGALTFWSNQLATQSLSTRVAPDAFNAIAPSWVADSIVHGVGAVIGSFINGAIETDGAKDIPYGCEAFLMKWLETSSPVPVGSWRSVGHSLNAFFVESFVDELAHAAGTDPLTFRQQHLERAGERRHLAVLAEVARMAGWDSRRGRHLGIAVHKSFGSVVAEVVEVIVKDGEIRVPHVWCAVDCGIAVYPDAVHAQMMGGVVFGLTAALHGRVSWHNGQIEQTSFDSYPLLRMSECPKIETKVVTTGSAVGGVGEPAVPPLAPALANAIFAATGKRLRNLPFTLE